MVLSFLNNKKTYGVAALMVIYALASVYFHQMTVEQALGWLLGSGGLASLRHSIDKIQAKLP